MRWVIFLIGFLFICSESFAQMNNMLRGLRGETLPTYTVERVLDGDSLKLTNGEIVNLADIDAPEMGASHKGTRDAARMGQDFETMMKEGLEAKEFLIGLGIEGRNVELTYGSLDKNQGGRFAYVYLIIEKEPDETTSQFSNKHLTYSNSNTYHVDVWTSRPVEGGWEDRFTVFLNATMIKAGYARPLIYPNIGEGEQFGLFKKLYDEAKKQKRGLWKQLVEEGTACENKKDCVNLYCPQLEKPHYCGEFKRPVLASRSCIKNECRCLVVCPEVTYKE